jgi:hypothetical protein
MSTNENLNEKKITFDVLGRDFTFSVTRAEYNKYINSISQNSKVAPSHNFLMGTVMDTERATLREFLKETPGSEVTIASAVLEEYTPDLNIVVKKSSSAQSE